MDSKRLKLAAAALLADMSMLDLMDLLREARGQYVSVKVVDGSRKIPVIKAIRHACPMLRLTDCVALFNSSDSTGTSLLPEDVTKDQVDRFVAYLKGYGCEQAVEVTGVVKMDAILHEVAEEARKEGRESMRLEIQEVIERETHPWPWLLIGAGAAAGEAAR